jgi:hypothetical protein
MEIRLQRRILELKPELTLGQLKDISEDVFDYWVDACLEDALEASEA